MYSLEIMASLFQKEHREYLDSIFIVRNLAIEVSNKSAITKARVYNRPTIAEG